MKFGLTFVFAILATGVARADILLHAKTQSLNYLSTEVTEAYVMGKFGRLGLFLKVKDSKNQQVEIFVPTKVLQSAGLDAMVVGKDALNGVVDLTVYSSEEIKYQKNMRADSEADIEADGINVRLKKK